MSSILGRMQRFVATHVDEAVKSNLDNGDGVLCPDTLRILRGSVPPGDSTDSMGLVDLYDLVSNHRAQAIKAEVRRLELEHDQLVEGMAYITAPLALTKLNERLVALEEQIADLRSQEAPLADRWETIHHGLHTLRERIAEAEVQLEVGTGRMKAQALRGAVARIEVFFEDVGDADSRLRLIRIVPRIGEPQEYEGKEFTWITLQNKPSPTKKRSTCRSPGSR
jgi:hypothetical protein